MPVDEKNLAKLLQSTKVLIVDDEAYMRKVIRTMLVTMGVRTIFEAPDGPSGIEAIRVQTPDIVILDWEMPGLDGFEFVRMVRSPDTFPYPDVPIIMLTGHGERSRVVEAVQVGINEFLLKPVSSKALQDRILTLLTSPRPMVKTGDYYGPAPRKLATYKPAADQPIANIIMVN